MWASSPSNEGGAGRKTMKGWSDTQILETLETDGYIVVPDVLSPKMVEALKTDLLNGVEAEGIRRGKDHVDYGMLLICCAYGRSFIDVLDNDEMMHIADLVLGSGCIIYAYGSSSMPPGRTNYSKRI